jgi:MarR family transcriptional regulator, organic hydroperoxide resistance regulator
MHGMIGKFNIENALGFVVNRASLVMTRKLNSMFKESGYNITPEEFVILSRLWEEDNLLQSEINERTLKDKSRVTRLLGGLAEKSLIEKRVDEADKRNLHINLTDKGKKMKYEILPIVIKLIKMSSNDIPRSDLEITIKTLKAIFNNVNSISKEKGED